MAGRSRWKAVGLAVTACSITLSSLLYFFLRGSGIGFYMFSLAISFLLAFVGVGVAVGVHASFTRKMTTEDGSGGYSVSSTEESGKKRKGSNRGKSD